MDSHHEEHDNGEVSPWGITETPYQSPDSSSTTSPCPRPIQDTKIVVQVGERRFTTTRATLVGGSGYFASRLSGRWNDAEPDGSYFVDGDSELFVHILRFLRSGTLPLFYNRVHGHDYSLYSALLAEARYYQITELVEWLRERKYIGRIMIQRKASILEDLKDLSQITAAGEDIEYHYAWRTEKVYVCPRGIPVHMGSPGNCGRACEKARLGPESDYEEKPILQVLVIRKQTVLVD